jgi:uncharacterized circularly permuted ATP-grasp superfamily protein
MMQDDGHIRQPYQGIYTALQQIDHPRLLEFERQSLKDFRGDNKLYHIPRMLSQQESHDIYTGVMQRARAIQAFLLDHYSGTRPKAYAASKVVPKSVMKSLLKRNGEKMLVQPGMDNWGFWYGPDVIRAPDGGFYVCEDNLGYVGGVGDLSIARKSLLNGFPEYDEHVDKQVLCPYRLLT